MLMLTAAHSGAIPGGGAPERVLTLGLLLGHDGVAERQQTEEVLGGEVPLPHQLHQAGVVEHKLGVGQLVPGEVHRLGFL